MHYNSGFKLEDQFVFDLNGKKVKELSRNLYYTMEEIFGILDPEESFEASKIPGFLKPDIKVTYKHQDSYISLKTGCAEGVHQEKNVTFLEFLKYNGISERTIETIKLFLYGDGTTDGTGNIRKSYAEVMFELKDRIKEANKELNSDKEFIAKVYDRCVFTGTINPKTPVTHIYHGNIKLGIVVSSSQIYKYIQRKPFNYLTSLHIGTLLIRPHARYVDKPVINEEYRHQVDLYWTNMNADMSYISTRYDG